MNQRYDESLFEETKMSFGEHLEELRKCLIKAMYGLVLSCGLALACGNYIVELVQSPFRDALKEFYKKQAITRYNTWLQEKRDQGATVPDDSAEVQDMVLNRNLLWREIYFQPSDLIHMLRKVSPEDIATPWIGRNLLKAEDFPNDHALEVAAALVARSGEVILLEDQTTVDAPVKRFWSELTPEQQQAIKDAKDPAAAQQALAALDAVLASAKIYDERSFSQSTIFGEAHQLASRFKDLKESELRRLNRLLLEGIFRDKEDWIESTQPTMVTLFTWYPLSEDDRIKLTSLGAQEAFMVYLKTALLAGAIVGSPWVFYQLWLFVAAGLFPHERSYVYKFLPISIGLFLLGASFAFLFVFRPVLGFLLDFNAWLGINPDPRISEWLGFVLILPLGFGVSFQLPLVMFFLERIGVFSIEAYLQKWRVSIMAIVVISAVLTPADPWSLLLMAIPLTLLYFVGIGLCKWFPRSRSPFAERAVAT